MYNTYRMALTTYERVNNQLKGSAQGQDLTNDQSIIEYYIHVASDEITEFCNRTFVPYIKTDAKQFYYDASRYWILDLPDDCLALTSVTDNGSTTIDSTYYRLRDVYNQLNSYPYRFLEISSSANISYDYSQTYLNPVYTIDGIWGYSSRPYANSWSTVTTITANLNTTETVIAVSDSSTFEILDYIRINSEFMKITANDTGTNQLTVTRNVNGSTATTHTSADSVELWNIEKTVKDACTRYAAYLYSNRQGTGNTIVFADGTVATQYPKLVWSSLYYYKRGIFASV